MAEMISITIPQTGRTFEIPATYDDYGPVMPKSCLQIASDALDEMEKAGNPAETSVEFYYMEPYRVDGKLEHRPRREIYDRDWLERELFMEHLAG
jgi:hypothetical protein